MLLPVIVQKRRESKQSGGFGLENLEGNIKIKAGPILNN